MESTALILCLLFIRRDYILKIIDIITKTSNVFSKPNMISCSCSVRLRAAASLLQPPGARLQPSEQPQPQRDLQVEGFLHLSQGRAHQARRHHRVQEVEVKRGVDGQHVTAGVEVRGLEIWSQVLEGGTVQKLVEIWK